MLAKINIIALFCILINNPLFSEWNRVSSPNGGTISQIDFQEGKLNTLCLNSGIYNFDFHNDSWNKLDKSNDLLRLTTAYSYDPINSYYYTAINKNGIFKSIDNTTWNKIHTSKNDTDQDIYIKKIKSYDNNVFFLSDSLVYLSQDYGEHWRNINSGLNSLVFYDVILFNSKIYLATNQGLFISDDFGKSWSSIVFQNITVYGVYLFNDEVFVSVFIPSSPNSTLMIYQKDSDSDNFTSYKESEFKDKQILSMSNYNNHIVILSMRVKDGKFSYDVNISSDNGSNWQVIKSFNDNKRQLLAPTVAISDSLIYLGTLNDGIIAINYLNTNNMYLNKGLDGILCNAYLNDINIEVVSSINNGIFYKDKQSNKWISSESSPIIVETQSSDYARINKLIKFNDKYYIATNRGIYQSNNGKDWSELALLEYVILDINIINGKMYCLGNFNSGYLFISSDLGNTWSSKKLPNEAIALSFLINDDNILVGSNLGLMSSVDEGNNWTIINNQFINNDVVRSITKQKNNSLLINTNKNIYFSIDGGINWVKSSKGLLESTIYNILTLGNVSIAATSAGTAFTYDYGLHWNYLNDGLESLDIYNLTSQDSMVYAFQSSGGIYKSNIRQFATIRINSHINNIMCTGSEFEITFEVNKNISFESDNKFYVQLSNPNGIFDDNSIICGEISSSNATTIIAKIPKNLVNGSGYRFRIISSSPELIGVDNFEDITIVDKPEPIILGELNVCNNHEYQYSITSSKDFTIKWEVSNGKIIGNDNEEKVSVKWNKVGNGNIRVKVSGISDCSDIAEINTVINPSPDKPIITFESNKLISSSETGNQWYLDSNIISNGTNKELIPVLEGNYQVKVTNEYDCSSELSDAYHFVNLSDKLVFKIDTITAYSGDEVTLKIRLLKNDKFYQLGVKSITADLVFNSSLLYPKSLDKGVVINNKRYLSISIDTNYIADDIVWANSMIAMLGDKDNTSIELNNLKINGEIYNEAKIIPGNFKMLGICYEGGPRLITSEPLLEIEKISPNPILNNFSLSLSSNENQNISIYLTDLLGNKLREIYRGNVNKGLNNLQCNIYNISIGDYYIVAEGNGSSSFHKILISR